MLGEIFVSNLETEAGDSFDELTFVNAGETQNAADCSIVKGHTAPEYKPTATHRNDCVGHERRGKQHRPDKPWADTLTQTTV